MKMTKILEYSVITNGNTITIKPLEYIIHLNLEQKVFSERLSPLAT